jgi:RNA polymerase-binding transcription factor
LTSTDWERHDLDTTTIVNIDHYRQRLLALERELVQRVGEEVDIARDARAEPGDAGDLSQVDELKEEYFALADTDSANLAQVRAALSRIDDGTYGKCVVDGEPIDEKRLESVPWTPHCLKHQSELEARAHRRTPTL